MAKVKNRRDNHELKRPKSQAGYTSREEREKERNSRVEHYRAKSGQKTGSAYKAPKTYSSGDSRFNKGAKPERRDFEREKTRVDRNDEVNTNIIVGRNPVTEALKSGREVDKLLVTSREGSMIKILAIAKEKGIPVMYVEKAALDRISNGQVHQGVAAYTSPYAYSEMDDIFKRAKDSGEEPFIMVLDGIEDPHNLGAIMRTAECAGCHGIIIPKRHASGLTEVVAKSSAGAIEYIPVVKVTNIAQTLDELKEKGIWIYACDMGDTNYYEAEMAKGGVAIVVGSEGFGISKLVKDKCDYVVSMPMTGKITSLNASNAAAVIMYEVRRQRNLNK